MLIMSDKSYLQRLYRFQALKQYRVRDLPSAPGGGEGELQREHCDALASDNVEDISRNVGTLTDWVNNWRPS
jgi:hypothetical protein